LRLEIDIPDDVAHYAPHLKNLLGLCVTKLFINAHKDTPRPDQAEIYVALLKREVEELVADLLSDRMRGNALLEIADIINFALLTYIALRTEQMSHKDKPHEVVPITKLGAAA
jgi:hypothetical protein